MSRSRKAPFVRDHVKGAKREANHRVRQTKEDIADGGAYKKIYNSWNISDWRFHSDRPKDRRK